MSTPKIDLEIFDTLNSFADLGLNQDLQKSIDKAGFINPTVIQSKLIPLALSGEDILGQSRTGSGPGLKSGYSLRAISTFVRVSIWVSM